MASFRSSSALIATEWSVYVSWEKSDVVKEFGYASGEHSVLRSLDGCDSRTPIAFSETGSDRLKQWTLYKSRVNKSVHVWYKRK
ncbi:hypothetical protein NFJ02_45g113010 [Pycnococcus provasolii]